MRRMPSCRGALASGFTLIEVLISILVFSFGILGAVGMQARTAQLSAQNGNVARASMLANEVVSEMWALNTVDQTTNATLTTFITKWQQRVAAAGSGLPSGAGTVGTTTDATGIVTATVTVTWLPPSQVGVASASNKFTTKVVIP